MFSKKGVVLFVAIWIAGSFSLQASTQALQKLPYKIIKTFEFKALWDSKSKDFLVIDTRNPEEYHDVHIPGAINIPQKKFDQYKHLLPKEKTTRLVFYCNGIK